MLLLYTILYVNFSSIVYCTLQRFGETQPATLWLTVRYITAATALKHCVHCATHCTLSGFCNLNLKKNLRIIFRCALYYRPGQSAHSETQCKLYTVLTVFNCVAYSVTTVLCAASTTANSSIQPTVLLLNWKTPRKMLVLLLL